MTAVEMSKKAQVRPSGEGPAGAGGSLPVALAEGARIEHEGHVFVVTAVEAATDTERRYRVREESDTAPTRWLRQAAPGAGERGPFALELEALRHIHEGRRFALLPEVVAHVRDLERGHLLIQDRVFAPTLMERWRTLADADTLSLTFEQIFLALSKLHRAGYIVVNLAPEAFVATDAGDLQLVEMAGLTRRGMRPSRVVESLYRPPELEDGATVDERTDIFAVGVMFASAWLERTFEEQAELAAALEEVELRQPVVTQLLQGSLTDRELRFVSVDEMRILVYQLKNEQARFPRPTAAVSSTVGVCRYRYINEDSAGFQELGVQYQSRPQHVGFYCVADGMGGHELGERASQLAVLGALQAFRQLTQEISFERLHDGLARFTLSIGRAASEVVCSGAEQFPGGARMGTTFSGVLVLNDELAVAHVGDSRAVLIREGKLTPLTLDHSLVASLVRVGQMTAEEAATSDERNVLVRCIDARLPMDESGFDSLAAVGFKGARLRMREGDVALLMSDGVWGALNDERILEQAAKGGGPQAIADAIVRAAILNGSDDNATALALVWA
jgi:PPM family protein phosphatase